MREDSRHGSPPAGVGQCNQIAGGLPTFTLIQAPTAFALRASNPLTCGANGRCPAVTPIASNLIPICDGPRVVAWLTANRQLFQCQNVQGGISTFSLNAAPTTFALRSSNIVLTCGQNGLCPNINPPRNNLISICDAQGLTRAFLTPDLRLLPPGGTAVATGSGQCLNQFNPPQFRLTASPNFGLVNGGNLYCTNQQCIGRPWF
ncbi:uncharacterized protein MELLADRAFT_116083 [Melampsora larici-populina 98AG31]|uniref:Uncharacterized protein n=1 Tax=Melampsora larici-populina (strain 98AG31 / pathotype 3-4-7) TaxID=747676 RepID=F4RH27_MELLP|nr:uncharacterized protein MELLADRAFT_116083 [Melampsora larici-populina 98AG31]EGG08304.1 hypothetical protein MELLADRAFT_116083 [Melampsora larici-populina 98AG31]